MEGNTLIFCGIIDALVVLVVTLLPTVERFVFDVPPLTDPKGDGDDLLTLADPKGEGVDLVFSNSSIQWGRCRVCYLQ